jgi:hypothetical protein
MFKLWVTFRERIHGWMDGWMDGSFFFFFLRREKHIQIRLEIPLEGVADLHRLNGGKSFLREFLLPSHDKALHGGNERDPDQDLSQILSQLIPTVLFALSRRFSYCMSRVSLVPPLWSSGQSSWLYSGVVLCFL